jgi:tetratricopeptide (TPR) repeat protein
MADARGVGPSLLGREREHLDLVDLLQKAARGSGAMAMLVGEPGIGKTSLADALAQEAEREGFRVAWGRAWESGGAPPYFPWAQALETLGLHPPDASMATAIEAEAVQFQVFRRVVEALLHVADISSLRMLQFVARELRSIGLLIVGTRRDRDARMSPEVESTLARIAREGKTVALGRLGREDVAQLVRTEGPRIPAELEPEIWRASQGNPLFVGELVRLLESTPVEARDGALPIPYGVREVIRQRLAMLDERALEVLDAAAVVGVEADESTIIGVSGHDREEVALAIEAAGRAGVINRAEGRRFRFAHALLRDALYGDITRTRRRALHAAVADVLERSDSPPLTEIAHHATLAGVGILERVSRAARELWLEYADEDALPLIESAVKTLDDAGDTRGGAELRLIFGQTRMRLGDLAGGRACCVRAAETARSLDDANLLARAALAHGAELIPGQTDPTLRALLEEAAGLLASAEERDAPILRVRLAARLAATLQPAPDPQAVARMAVEAVHAARALGDEPALLEVLHNAGAALGEAVFEPEGLEMAREAVRIASALGDRARLFRARLRLVFSLMEVGDVAAADANIEAFDAEVRATGQAKHLWAVSLLRSMRAMQEGRFADSDALVEEAEESAARSCDRTARAALFTHRYARIRLKELAAEAIAIEPELIAMAGQWNDPDSYTNVMIATVRAVAAETETARAHLARISLDSIPARIRISFGALAAAALKVGETDRAAEYYERLLPDERRWHMFTVNGFAAEGTYARYLGGFATMLGRYDDAERHFRVALELAEAASARPERARILAARGGMLLARGGSGDVSKAHDAFREARAIATELGLERLVASIPVPVDETQAPDAGSRSLAGPGALTLVADGDTWLLSLGSTSTRLKDGRGIQYIARLVAEPERELHALDLAGASEEAAVGDSGEQLDAEARAAYKRRLREVDEELREAEGWNDGARTTRLRAELEFLSAELSRAVGLGGRARRAGSAAERARVAVTRRIRELVRRVSEQTPEIGRYLENTVRTGTYCCYRPNVTS